MPADLFTAVVLPVCLSIIMLGMGLSLHRDDFSRVLTQPKAVIIGVIAQMLLLPIIAFSIALVFELPPLLAVGLMIISFAPGGATSNLFTNLANGDVALSISLTAIVSLVTPFTLPLFTIFSMNYFIGSSDEFSLPLLKTITQLLAITVVPVIIGMFILSRWESLANKIEPVIKALSVVFLFIIMMVIGIKNKEQMADFFLQTGSATLSLNLIVLALGYFLGKFYKLSEAQSISISYEVGIQNGTLAFMVAGTLIGNSTMMIPAVTYSTLMCITGFIFGSFLKRQRGASLVLDS